MQYLSTRGGISPISFTQGVMMGLAEDGGLLLPRTIPRVGGETFASWHELSYTELAFEILSRFIDDIPASDLRDIINKSYASFNHQDVTPLIHQGGLHILELFHGPTLAFKDVALQFLGNLFEYLLQKSGEVLNIVGATSGDTGSAAIYGVRGKSRINIFILHPKGRVSPVQEKQMTTVLDDNVFNLAIEGSFDDGQAIVKKIFNDVEFKNRYRLGAINSINWARVLAQVVYYVHSCIHVSSHEKDSSVDFAIPTGNFGDIFAGYIAKKMLPPGTIRQLVLATNDNDILSRFVNSGDYSLGEVRATTSPSMDIQAASNFERYLYYLTDSDTAKTRDLMEQFSATGKIDLKSHLDQVKRDFAAAAVTEQEVFDTIRTFYTEHGYVLDPHTAVGVKAALQLRTAGVPMVCLATAHPAKFGEVVESATGQPMVFPEPLQGIGDKQSRCQTIAANVAEIQTFVANNSLT
ncbi:threonine synthase [Desulforhopalus singaporensis]|uniref:Threonine synthase n=1 Tax=Desulforhopalus singaporensis TaxID=91360 RepID=A0A1H0J8Y6_9BACT|nr:threonine synthase [Desulforhopalus singaporensis]SDO40062.1 L-threonine synthase [Desulforhopalus singaporensis]